MTVNEAIGIAVVESVNDVVGNATARSVLAEIHSAYVAVNGAVHHPMTFQVSDAVDETIPND